MVRSAWRRIDPFVGLRFHLFKEIRLGDCGMTEKRRRCFIRQLPQHSGSALQSFVSTQTRRDKAYWTQRVRKESPREYRNEDTIRSSAQNALRGPINANSAQKLFVFAVMKTSRSGSLTIQRLPLHRSSKYNVVRSSAPDQSERRSSVNARQGISTRLPCV